MLTRLDLHHPGALLPRLRQPVHIKYRQSGVNRSPIKDVALMRAFISACHRREVTLLGSQGILDANMATN
jgi:hypothetical protein